jgi:hypothetical protein
MGHPVGKYVTFYVTHQSKTNTYIAQDVKPVEQETDLAVLAWCAWERDRASWEPTILKYVTSLSPVEARRFIQQKMVQLSAADQATLLSMLPPDLRPGYAAAFQRRVSKTAGLSPDLGEPVSATAADRTASGSEAGTAPRARLDVVYLKSLSNNVLKARGDEREKWLRSLALLLASCTDRQTWARVPDAIVATRPVWSIAPDGRKLEYLARQAQDRSHPNTTGVIQQITKLLDRVSSNEARYYVSLLPEWARQHRVLAARDPSNPRRTPSARWRISAGYVVTHSSGTSKEPRLTYCWSCETDLDSREDPTCADCRWLICPRCGSCSFLCRYAGRSSPG